MANVSIGWTDSILVRRIKTSLSEEIASRIANLARGTGVPDFATYRERVGEIQGLTVAQTLLDEVLKGLTSDEP